VHSLHPDRRQEINWFACWGKSSKVWVSWLTRKSPPARQVAPIHSVRAPSAPSFFRTLMILFVQKKKRTPSQSAQQTHLLAPATEFEYHGKSMSHKSSHSRVFKHPSSQTRTFISPIECHHLLHLWTALTNEPIVRALGYLRIDCVASALHGFSVGDGCILVYMLLCGANHNCSIRPFIFYVLFLTKRIY
jgi:hypothetical protein